MALIIAEYWQQIQASLFPYLSERLECKLTDKLEQLVLILDRVQIERFIPSPFLQRLGRKAQDRRPMARAFIAKAVYGLPTTKLLREMLLYNPPLRRICGWERKNQVPSEPTLSRAFAEFAQIRLGDKTHLALIREHIGDQIVMHLSRDSTELPAREKPAAKPKGPKKPPRSRRTKDGQVLEMTRVERQLGQSAAEALAELPRVCDAGVKKDSKGNLHTVIGYKVHIDWADDSIPINVETTSVSLHDSQVAIPMARTSAERVQALYELMDQAFDAPVIRQAICDLGHVPLIEGQRRRKDYVPFDPAQERRYDNRTTAERGNSRLKDAFGFRQLRVRGHAKVHLHAMFAILALFVDNIFKPWQTAT